MRRHELVQYALPFEEDVRNVEYCEQPLVAISIKIQILLHSRDLGIAIESLAMSTTLIEFPTRY